MDDDIFEVLASTKADVVAGLSLLVSLGREVRHMAGELDDLKAKVAANTTVVQSAITLIKGLKAKLDAAGTDPAALAALSAELGAQDAALAAAVAENTPAQ